MEQIINYLIEFSPAITAMISVIVAIIVGFKKIKGHNDKTLGELKETEQRIIIINEQRVKDNEDLRRENAELKADLRKVMAKLNHVIIIEDDK